MAKHSKEEDEPRGKHAKIELPEITDEEVERDKLFTPAFGTLDPVGAHVDIPQEKKGLSKLQKGLLIALGVVVTLLLAAYAAGAFYFSGHFFPHSTLATTDISFQTATELKSTLKTAGKDYSLRVEGYGLSFKVDATSCGFNYNSGEIVDQILATQSYFAWPYEIFQEHDMGEALKGTYDASTLEASVTKTVEEHNKNATETVNASLSYNPTTKQFEAKAETYGTMLDVNLVIDAVEDAIENVETSLELSQAHLVQPTIKVSDARFDTALKTANTMVKSDVLYKMGDFEAVRVDADTSNVWVIVDENLNVTFDDAAMTAWAEELAKSCNTLGGKRTYTRPDGKECEVEGGDYGWKIDQAAFVSMVETNMHDGNSGTEQIPVTDYANAFNGVGKADWNARYIDVDLTEQHVYYYDENSEIIWESDCVSGSTLTAGRATPTGVYDLNAKESPSTLIGYKDDGEKEYETKVQYWMPFIGNGVGFHDASWQSAFGGERYKQGYGSHGCINLPVDAAAELYEIISYNDAIVVHY